jgi:hypothetical protein
MALLAAFALADAGNVLRVSWCGGLSHGYQNSNINVRALILTGNGAAE